MFAVTMRGVGKIGKLLEAGEEEGVEGAKGGEGLGSLAAGYVVSSARCAAGALQVEEGEVKEGEYSCVGGPLFRDDRLGPLVGWGSSPITMRFPYS